MATDKPYSMGIFETIVDVHFGGLAVEFFGPGDYEQIVNGVPNTKKLTISFWFRVSSATLQASYDSWVGDNSPFDGVTPLLIFGDPTVTGYQFFNTSSPYQEYAVEAWTYGPVSPPGDPPDLRMYIRDGMAGTAHTVIDTPTRGADIPMVPCWIGIDSNRRNIESWDPEDGPPPKRDILTVNIQLADFGEGSGLQNYRITETSTDFIRFLNDGDDSGDPRGEHEIGVYGPDFYGNVSTYITDQHPWTVVDNWGDSSEDLIRATTESFVMQLHTKSIVPDRWHHVRLALDLSGTVRATGYQLSSPLADPNNEPDHGSITSSCFGYLALDGIDYRGSDIRDPTFFDDYITERLTLTPNGLYTPMGVFTGLHRVAASGTTGELASDNAGFTFEFVNNGLVLPTYVYSPQGVPFSGFALGVPATSDFSGKVLDVEMAELQIYTGKADRSIGLFLSPQGKPVSPTVAMKKLGKPAVLLHTSHNWIKGKNTGTGDQFDPNGRIERYIPDPSLHGPQSPADLKK